MKPKIGFVLPLSHDVINHSDLVRGWEMIAYDHSKILIKNGYHVFWVVCGPARIRVKQAFDEIHIVKVKNFSRFLPKPISLLIDLIRIMEAEKLSVVYTRVSWLGFFAALGCKLTRTPFVFHAEDVESDVIFKQQGILKDLQNRILIMAYQKISIFLSKRVVTVSKAFKDFLVKTWHVSESKISVVYEGVPASGPKIHVASPPFRIIHVGGTLYYDGLDVLLKAYEHLVSRFENVELTIATFSSDREIAPFRKLCSSLGISHKVRFITSVTGDKAKELVSQSHIGVISRRRTLNSTLTTSSVLFVYLSEGVPVVVPKLNAITEIIDNPELLFDPDSPCSLARTLLKILADERLLNALCKYTLDLKEKFDRNKTSEALVKAVEQALQ